MSAAADESAARLAGIRRLAPILVALLLAVVAVSAWLRLNAAGAGCADWPACYARMLAGAPAVAAGPARMLHRVVASGALLLALLLAWRALRPWPLRGVTAPAAGLVAVMLLLSAVGVWSADPARVPVNLVNLLGGLALVSLSWRVVLATASPRSAGPKRRDALLASGLAALTATVLLGALIGARYAASACATLPDCHGVWWPAADGLAALDPFGRLAGPAPAGDAGGTALHLLHRYCAAATALLLGLAAAARLPVAAARRSALVVLALLAAEIALGILTVASGYGVWLAVAHNVGAAALLAGAADMQRR